MSCKLSEHARSISAVSPLAASAGNRTLGKHNRYLMKYYVVS